MTILVLPLLPVVGWVMLSCITSTCFCGNILTSVVALDDIIVPMRVNQKITLPQSSSSLLLSPALHFPPFRRRRHHRRRRRVTADSNTVTTTRTTTTATTRDDIRITSGEIIALLTPPTNHTVPSTIMTPLPPPSKKTSSSYRNDTSTSYSSNVSSSAVPTITPPPFPSVSLVVVPSPAPFPTVQLLPSYSPTYYMTTPPRPPVVSPLPIVLNREVKPFKPLHCNANLTTAPCQSWTSMFGTFNKFATLVTVPCGTCIIMDVNDRTLGSSPLELLGGIDIHGKLVFPDTGYGSNYTLSIIATMMVVQGELSMTSVTKPINGRPNIHITMVGQNINHTFTPVDNNAMGCTIGNTVTPTPCTIGKKAIVVAGGKVNSKLMRFIQNAHTS